MISGENGYIDFNSTEMTLGILSVSLLGDDKFR